MMWGIRSLSKKTSTMIIFGCHGMDFSAYWISTMQKDPFVEFVESHQIVICDAAIIRFKRKFIAERLASAKKVKSNTKYIPKYS